MFVLLLQVVKGNIGLKLYIYIYIVYIYIYIYIYIIYIYIYIHYIYIYIYIIYIYIHYIYIYIYRGGVCGFIGLGFYRVLSFRPSPRLKVSVSGLGFKWV